MLPELFLSSKNISRDFLRIAALLSFVDQPLKNSVAWEDIDQQMIENMAIETNAVMVELCNGDYMATNALGRVKETVETALKKLPIRKILDQEEGHRQAFAAALKKILGEAEFEKSIQNSRLLVLWLLLLALELGGGEISSNKLLFSHDVAQHFHVETDVFDELLGQAKVGHQWLKKTLTILLD